ncbi:MAG TPA: TetR/AcrR family transcriptional regulator [Amycolatopsis sp.]|nr:TetR/AcrR family transcriptional regulator [Amycolatopsis sp.]
MTDRRIRRTRRTLHDALLTLVLEKGYERITVQDILDRADIGRSTFYAHYRDKDALLLSSFEDLSEQIQAELGPAPSADPARPAEVLFSHAHRHRRIYRALCGHQGGAVVHRHLHRLIGDLLRAHLGPPRAGIDVDVAAEFYTSAALGLLLWWVDQGFPHDAAWLTAAYRKLATGGT